MRYGSVCSGIEAASVAWKPLGWKAEFFSEIEAFPCAVLKHHYPDVPNHGDMTKFQEWPDHAIDLLVGGTPCQSFSIAGLRAGLADPRGNLALTYLAIAAKYNPRWILWENVPGVFSSNSHDAPDPSPPPDPVDMELDGQEVGTSDHYEAIETSAFGTFLAGLSELGYGVAYRVLDAQFCRTHGFAGAVPQRRRRVFVVGYLGDWRRAAAVLFDGASLRGDPEPRREAGQNVAPTISARPTGGGGLGTDFDLDGGQTAVSIAAPPISPALKARDSKGPSSDGDGDGDGAPLLAVTEGISPTVDSSQPHAVAFQERGGRSDGVRLELQEEVAYALTAPSGGGRSQERNVLTPAWAVRRLTPTECARLQGFPDDYLSQVKHRGKPAADGPMYKAFGNSMAVNVMRIIGERIALIDAIP